MWIVVLTGVFSVLTLLVQAAIAVGTKTTRWRRSLTQDLELVAKLREAHPSSIGVWDLEQRIDRHVVSYAWLGTSAPSDAPDAGPSVHTSPRALTRIAIVALTFLLSLLAGFGLSEATSAFEQIGGPRYEALLGFIAAALGIATSVLGAAAARRNDEKGEPAYARDMSQQVATYILSSDKWDVCQRDLRGAGFEVRREQRAGGLLMGVLVRSDTDDEAEATQIIEQHQPDVRRGPPATPTRTRSGYREDR